MKKGLAVLLCACMLIGGCTPSGNDDNQPADGSARNVLKGKLAEYVVMKENTAYVYRDDAMQLADYTYYIEYVGDGIMQRRIDGMNETIVEVLQFDEKSISLVYTESRYNRRENLMDSKSNIDSLWIGKPLAKGVKWSSTEMPMEYKASTEVTAVDIEVTVPYGTFNAIELTKVYEESDFSVKEYYAKGVGLIKTISITAGNEIVSELAEIHENVAQSAIIPLFYMENGERVYDVWELEYKTNDDVIAMYNERFPQHFAEKFGVEESILHIEDVELDYDSEGRPAMNVIFNSGMMMQTIPAEASKCMADTLGYMFGTMGVRFIAGNAILLLKDVEQDTEGVVMCEPIATEEDEAADADTDVDAEAGADDDATAGEE